MSVLYPKIVVFSMFPFIVTQSLLLDGALPFTVSTPTGESVIAQGVEGGCVNIPLHKVNLVSDLITVFFVVGTRSTLPIKRGVFAIGK